MPPAEWPDGHRAGRWPAPLGRRVSALLLASRSFVIRMAVSFSSSAVRFWLLPMLIVPILSVPGFSRAVLTKSAML